MMSFRPLLLALIGLLLVVSTLAGTSEDGLKWLAQKKLEDGVVTRDSGLMYKEIRPGNTDGKSSRVSLLLVSVVDIWIEEYWGETVIL